MASNFMKDGRQQKMTEDMAVHPPFAFPRKFGQVRILLATKLSNYHPNVRLAEHQQDGLP
jgi:hypothetical protein